MDEYIKREDALDALMFELEGSGYQSRARDVIRLLPTADVAPRAAWISVDERLPQSDTRCIVWSFDYIWHIRFASYNRGTERWYVVCGGQIKDTKRDGVKVTHWMPLPEPPKGD